MAAEKSCAHAHYRSRCFPCGRHRNALTSVPPVCVFETSLRSVSLCAGGDLNRTETFLLASLRGLRLVGFKARTISWLTCSTASLAGARHRCRGRSPQKRAHERSARLRLRDLPSLGLAMRWRGFEPEEDGRLAALGAATSRIQIPIEFLNSTCIRDTLTRSLVGLNSERCAGGDLNPGCDHGKVT